MSAETNGTTPLSPDRIPVDADALQAFLERYAADQAATAHAATVVIRRSAWAVPCARRRWPTDR